MRCAAALCLSVVPIHAQGVLRKLSEPLPVGIEGAITDYVLAPGGAHVVFRVNVPRHRFFGLYAAPSDASSPAVRLVGSFPEGRGVEPGYVVTDDGTRVVYLADANADERFELFVVELDGSTSPRRLNGPLVHGGDVREFRVSPDGPHAVYIADAFTDERRLLFSVALDGTSGPVILNGALPVGGDVKRAEIIPGGTYVVYRADQDTADLNELYRVPIAGGDSLKLSLPVAGSGDVLDYWLVSPDGARVLYAARGTGDTSHRLYSVSIDGGPSVRLFWDATDIGDLKIDPLGHRAITRRQTTLYRVHSQPLDASTAPITIPTINVSQFEANPDGSRLVFRAGSELFSVPIDGSAAPVQICGPLPPNDTVSGFRIAPDGSAVLLARRRGAERVLQRAPIDGSAAPLDLLSITSNDWPSSALRLSDSGQTAFLLDGPGSRLFSVPFDGSSAAVEIIAPSAHMHPDFAVTPDGALVLYRADHDVPGNTELFVTPSTAAAPVQLNEGFPFAALAGDVSLFEQSEQRAIYVADGDVAGVYELYGVATRGPAAAVRLNGPLVGGGDVVRVPAPQLSLDGTRAFYLADQQVDDVVELFSVASDGSSAPVRLNLALGPLADVSSYRVDPAGTWVLYVADRDIDEAFELYATLADGSATSLKLNPPFSADRDVVDCRFTPDGQRALYLADQDADETYELYSRQGLSPAVRLNGVLTAGGDVVAFEIAATSDRVVYRADQLVDDTFELFSVPVDGSAPAVRISHALSGGDDVSTFTLDPVSQRVLYTAEVYSRLYSVPIGGGAAVRLDPESGVVPGCQASPDGTFVVFVGRKNGTINALLRAPVDGSAPALELDGPVGGFDVPVFVISPDSTWVAFHKSSSSGEELYVVPSDYSIPPVMITPPLVGGGHVDPESIRISPDSASIAYLAERDVNDRVQLLLTHGRTTFDLSGPLADDVRSFEFSADWTQVLFLAEVSDDDSAELFARTLSRAVAADEPTETVAQEE